MPNNKRAKALAKALRKERNERIALQIAFDSTSVALENLTTEFKRVKTQGDYDANKLRGMELHARANARKSLELQYTEIRADFPILWVTSQDQSAVNAGTYAQIRDMLSRIAPSIEAVIFTYGDLKIWELEDKDLEKIGLCRIKGHEGGCVGREIKKLDEGNGF